MTLLPRRSNRKRPLEHDRDRGSTDSRAVFPIVCFVLLIVTSVAIHVTQPARFSITRVYELRPGESVFAYSRISPSGRYLAYASEVPDPRTGGIVPLQTVIDLRSHAVVFAEPGVDAYWSIDETQFVFLSLMNRSRDVALHTMGGGTKRNVAPAELGDYFSWAHRGQRDLIMTINGNFYYLDHGAAVLPAQAIVDCPGFGRGLRPLVSKDGRRATVFVDGDVAVRDVGDCDNVIDSGLQGAKADFSFDGRYIAFHVQRSTGVGSEIAVVDTKLRTLRRLTGLLGSSLFPSWTRDGDISFRYESPDYRGFVIAQGVLSLPEEPLPIHGRLEAKQRRWEDLFVSPSSHRTELVMLWSEWSAHVPQAVADLQRLKSEFGSSATCGFAMAIPPAADMGFVQAMIKTERISLPTLTLRPGALAMTGALNQIPTELLFRDGVLVDERLGPLDYLEMRRWLEQVVGAGRV